MSKQSTRKASWWRRNPALHDPIDAVAVALISLAVISVTAFVVGVDSVKYSKVQSGLFLMCVGGVLMVLLLKPPSMWRSLISGMRDIAAGRELHVEGAVAVIVAVLMAAIAVVATLIVDWTVLTLRHGISAVVAVNLALVGRGLLAKYGSRANAGRRR